MKVPITLRLEEEQLLFLERKRLEIGVNVNEQVRRLIQAEIDKEKEKK